MHIIQTSAPPSSSQPSRVHLVDTEPFSDTFGPKSRRKRPKLAAEDYSTLLQKVDSVNGREWGGEQNGIVTLWREEGVDRRDLQIIVCFINKG